jgi:RHS repeat-associated protein
LGRRVAIVTANDDGTAETRYLWCGERICQARDSADNVTRRYYAEGEFLSTSGALYYVQDHLGSVREVQAVDGATAASFDYDPYGNLIQSGGAAAPDFRYAGMFYEQSSGLYLTQFRAYDPVMGRWLSRDPIGLAGGPNTYEYAGSDPIARNDPVGLRWLYAVLWSPSPQDKSVGHAALLEGDGTTVILSEFPKTTSHKDDLLPPLTYEETIQREGRNPTYVFEVWVPDDDALDKVAAEEKARKTWDFWPTDDQQTNCTTSVFDALIAGGVKGLTLPTLPPYSPNDLLGKLIALSKDPHSGVKLFRGPWD